MAADVFLIEGSALSSEPCLFAHKLLTWPPCGGTVDCWNAWWFLHSHKCNLLHLIAADVSHHQWTCSITYFEAFLQNLFFFFCSIALLCEKDMVATLQVFCAKQCDVQIGWNCWVIGIQNPLYKRKTCTDGITSEGESNKHFHNSVILSPCRGLCSSLCNHCEAIVKVNSGECKVRLRIVSAMSQRYSAAEK